MNEFDSFWLQNHSVLELSELRLIRIEVELIGLIWIGFLPFFIKRDAIGNANRSPNSKLKIKNESTVKNILIVLNVH